MKTIDLNEYASKVIVRPMRHDDIDALIALQTICFEGMPPCNREQLASQISRFPEGQICIEIDNRIVASCSSLIVDYDSRTQWHDYHKVADGGYIRNHNPRGDTLYGIEMMVDPEFRGMRLSRRMYDARKSLCRDRNLARIIVGGRLPGYAKVAAEFPARTYIEKVMEKQLYDPVLTAQVSNGFALQGLIENYLPKDIDSLGYATFLEWRNFEYKADAKRRFHHPTEPLRLCVVQYQLRTIESFDDFAKQCEFFMDVASDYKSDFVLFPELFTTQLLSCIAPNRPGLAARELAAYTPQYLEFFSEASIRYNVNVIAGSHFVVEDDDLFNIAYLFGRDGSIGKQYKIHITPSERKWWGVKPGRKLELFQTDCGPIAIQICYDIEFPELARVAAHQGANIIFVPFNTDTRHGYLRVRYCAQARCIENHVYVAISGCTGNLPFVDNADIHYAQSGVFTPSSEEFARDAVAAECNANIETVVIHDLDVEILRRHRAAGGTQNWNDRRHDLYRIRYSGNDSEIDA